MLPPNSAGTRKRRALPLAGATPMQPKNGCKVARVVDWIQPDLLRRGRAHHGRVVGGRAPNPGAKVPHLIAVQLEIENLHRQCVARYSSFDIEGSGQWVVAFYYANCASGL